MWQAEGSWGLASKGSLSYHTWLLTLATMYYVHEMLDRPAEMADRSTLRSRAKVSIWQAWMEILSHASFLSKAVYWEQQWTVNVCHCELSHFPLSAHFQGRERDGGIFGQSLALLRTERSFLCLGLFDRTSVRSLLQAPSNRTGRRVCWCVHGGV